MGGCELREWQIPERDVDASHMVLPWRGLRAVLDAEAVQAAIAKVKTEAEDAVDGNGTAVGTLDTNGAPPAARETASAGCRACRARSPSPARTRSQRPP